MKQEIQQWVETALRHLQSEGVLSVETLPEVQVSVTNDTRHGDFACNIAMMLARVAKMPPRDLAQKITAAIPESSMLDSVEIAGPGFINFRLTRSAWQSVVRTVLSAGRDYGQVDLGAGQRVQVEYVSANPTGPLHVGHGRGAAYGSVVADLLAMAGYEVEREYYVNDAGRQMDILAASVWLRYLELCGLVFSFPSNGYRGDYIWDIAANLHREHGERFLKALEDVYADVPADEVEGQEGGDKEAHIDALIARTEILLGEDYWLVFNQGLETILADIKDDLELFRARVDFWYSERTLMERGLVNKLLTRLENSGHIYEKNGAKWFRSTEFGDEKDRVVVRENGQTTYFASDIAYHMDKIERGFDRIIDVWGADHHGYVPRVKAAMQALGLEADRLDVLLVQFANLYRGGEKVQMSTRSGEFVTLRALRKEVGTDAARFFYVMRKSDQHLDFDLDLARAQSNENPVYYLQYAHARVCSVLRQAEEKGFSLPDENSDNGLELLVESHEQDVLRMLSRFPEVIGAAAAQLEPHQVANYLRDLANEFHTYYNAHTFLVEDDDLREGRLKLVLAVRYVLQNGLSMLGVEAPEKM